MFAPLRQTLAHAANKYGGQLLETAEFRERVGITLTQCDRWEQRQCKLTAPLVVWFVFSMVLRRSVSMASLTKSLLSDFRYGDPRLSLSAVTPEAFVHARERLGSKPLKLMFEQAAAEVKVQPSFHGLRVWAADGTTMNVPDTIANEKAFGRPKASRGRGQCAFPQLRLVSLLETVGRRIAAVAVGRSDQAERAGLVTLLKSLGVGDLLLLDRGLSAAWLFERSLEKHGIHTLGRISSSWKPRVLRRLGAGDFLVEVTGDVPKDFRRKASLSAPRGPATVMLTMRMIEFTVGGGERVRLLTTLLDAERFPTRELAELYHQRWEVEMGYDEVKTHLASVGGGCLDLAFRSKTPGGVYQELYAYLCLYNMVRTMMLKAAHAAQVSPLDISFTMTLELIRTAMPRYLAARTLRAKEAVYQQLLQDIAESQNRRPRRRRKCPRGVKVKMSNYHLKHGKHETVLDVTVVLL